MVCSWQALFYAEDLPGKLSPPTRSEEPSLAEMLGRWIEEEPKRRTQMFACPLRSRFSPRFRRPPVGVDEQLVICPDRAHQERTPYLDELTIGNCLCLPLPGRCNPGKPGIEKSMHHQTGGTMKTLFVSFGIAVLLCSAVSAEDKKDKAPKSRR